MFGEGVMFHWKGRQSLTFGGTSVITFACSIGDVLDERILFRAWASVPANRTWEEEGYRNQWGSLRFPWDMSREWYQEKATDDETDVAGLYYVTLTVNAMAALSTEYTVDVLRQKKGTKRRSRTGGVSRVRNIELDADGLAVWSKRYVEQADHGYSEGSKGERDTPGDRPEPTEERDPVALHRRDPTMAAVWVHESNLEPGEFIDAEEVRPNGRRYCRVYRKRKGGPVGGTVKERRERLRAGIDDLNIPGEGD
jgi:hypothetical protein